MDNDLTRSITHKTKRFSFPHVCSFFPDKILMSYFLIFINLFYSRRRGVEDKNFLKLFPICMSSKFIADTVNSF